MDLHAVCHTCRRSHALKGEPETYFNEQWEYKHRGHKLDVLDLDEFALHPANYPGNADIKIAYVATATITITLASLGSSATWVAGQESAAQDNGTNKYVDAVLRGKITVGTTPTINTQIRAYLFSAINDTPTWPDVMDGTDSAETITSVGVGNGFLKLAALLDVDATTSDREYPFSARKSHAALFGAMPQDWGVFVTHNTGVALNATGGNHLIYADQLYYTVA